MEVRSRFIRIDNDVGRTEQVALKHLAMREIDQQSTASDEIGQPNWAI